jgi:F-type H+-transporting ATPase subunit b
MAVGTSHVVIVAQAESGADALQQGVVVSEPAPATTETIAHTETAGEEAVGFPPFDASHFLNHFIWLLLTFGFLYILMSRAALPRIGGILEQRRTRIDGDLREADRLRQETDRAIAAYEAALAEARQRAHGIAEETRQSIKADIEGKRAGVEADLARKVGEAEARIAQSKAGSLANVETIATDIAQALVTQLAGEVPAGAAQQAVATAARS